MLTLYYAKATAALAPHILLEEVGAEYDLHLLDFASKQHQAADYLAVNPKGRVPTLKTPEGLLTETPAILTYIGQTFPKAGMLPETPFDLGRAQAFNTYLAATVHVNHAHRMRGARWSDDPAAHESMRAKVAQNMTDCAAVIEAHYLSGPWVMGEAYTICDPYLYVISRWMEVDDTDLARFPRLASHRQAMEDRAAVQAVLPLHS